MSYRVGMYRVVSCSTLEGYSSATGTARNIRATPLRSPVSPLSLYYRARTWRCLGAYESIFKKKPIQIEFIGKFSAPHKSLSHAWGLIKVGGYIRGHMSAPLNTRDGPLACPAEVHAGM